MMHYELMSEIEDTTEGNPDSDFALATMHACDINPSSPGEVLERRIGWTGLGHIRIYTIGYRKDCILYGTRTVYSIRLLLYLC